MPLTPVSELTKLSDKIAGTLDCAGYYTMATEDELNAKFGK